MRVPCVSSRCIQSPCCAPRHEPAALTTHLCVLHVFDPQPADHRVKNGVLYASQQQERSQRRHRYDTIIEGVGCDRVTANFATAQIDHAVRVEDAESIRMAQALLNRDGLFVGASAAMHCCAAVEAARRLGPGHTIVTVLCDGGHRYLASLHAPRHLHADVDPNLLDQAHKGSDQSSGGPA
jgi:hypothetical protein